MKIMIDPGHGGFESGAISITNVKEKDINLSVALYLKELLLQTSDVEVKLTREMDTSLTIPCRCNVSNEWDADICISIHHNAFNGNASGYEIIHTIHHGNGEQLARVIAEEFEKLGQKSHWKGVYSKESANNPGHDYYGMIRGTQMPCIITEYAYIDSKDFYKIDTAAEQKLEAESIYNALCRYYNLKQTKAHWGEQYYKRLVQQENMILNVPTNYDRSWTAAEQYANNCKLLDRVREIIKGGA